MNRDCADGLCVTEAISRFAAELGNTSLPVQQRREAFGFVCHFVGDLSQPLHAGYASDRGGNDFTIIVDGQTSNIHRFWDSTVINYKTGHWNSLQKELQKQFSIRPGKRWDESMPANWTTESYILATTRAYPVNPGITEEFTEESWVLIRQQLATGGRNLATVLTSVLGK